MEHYLLIARSVTQAQRMASVLTGKGLRGGVLRAPTALNPKGCSYAVRIGRQELARAQEALQAAGIQPLHIYEKTEQGYREVAL